MDRYGRRAIIASVSGQPVPGLAAMLESLGYTVSGHARDASSALRLAESLLPDLILADAVLPGMDGVMLAKQLLSKPLNRYPAILLMALPGAMISNPNNLTKQGVSVITKPCTEGKIREALEKLTVESRRLPPEKAVHLDMLLDALGVPPHPGRIYLADAVTLTWLDSSLVHSLKENLYPVICRKEDISPAQAARAMRYAIDYAWRTGEIEQQHKIFGDTIDARRGKPTCGEMIARLADILRWEGRQ